MQTWNFLLNLKMAIFEIQGWYGCQFSVAMFDPIIEPSSRISATIPERASARQRWYSQANLFRCFDFLTKIVKCVTDPCKILQTTLIYRSVVSTVSPGYSFI